MSLSCTVNEILSLISQNLKRSRDTLYIPAGGSTVVYHACASTLRINQQTKFEVPTSPFLKIWIWRKI